MKSRMTQGQFFRGVNLVLDSEPVAIPKLKSSVYPTIYP